jgi:phosphoglycolate phosphatase-like HAD superfamily hydrolase
MNHLLNDVDGTLLNCPKYHLAAYQPAYNEVFGVDVPEKVILGGVGLTAMGYYRDICTQMGIGFEDSQIQDVSELCEGNMIGLIRENGVAPLPHVVECLDFLKDHGIELGIVTGNAEKVGEVLLDYAGLNEYFGVRCYGDTAEHKRDIVAEALKQLNGSADKVGILGDTPFDIEAAKHNDIIAIAVATGRHSEEELRGYGPDLVLPNLKGKRKILELLI